MGHWPRLLSQKLESGVSDESSAFSNGQLNGNTSSISKNVAFFRIAEIHQIHMSGISSLIWRQYSDIIRLGKHGNKFWKESEKALKLNKPTWRCCWSSATPRVLICNSNGFIHFVCFIGQDRWCFAGHRGNFGLHTQKLRDIVDIIWTTLHRSHLTFLPSSLLVLRFSVFIFRLLKIEYGFTEWKLLVLLSKWRTKRILRVYCQEICLSNVHLVVFIKSKFQFCFLNSKHTAFHRPVVKMNQIAHSFNYNDEMVSTELWNPSSSKQRRYLDTWKPRCS